MQKLQVSLLRLQANDKQAAGSQYMLVFFSLLAVGPLWRVASWVTSGLLFQRLRARTSVGSQGMRLGQARWGL